jgi:pyrimidine-nucleoside phosphorylase
MASDEDAVNLAKAMVRIGNNVGRQTMAVISDMSQPLRFDVKHDGICSGCDFFTHN